MRKIMMELPDETLPALELKRFRELTDRLALARDPEEQGQLKDELARMIFGE